jgi:hypothetical protein
MLGRAAVAMWWDIAAEVRSDWEEWHTVEHMPERLGIPGFLRGTRWVGLDDEGTYFVLYEAAELATITSGPYLDRLNNPTPWSRRMMPHHRNMVRSLCLVRGGYGDGVAYAMATLRFSPRADLPPLPRRQGVTCAYLLESQHVSGAPTAEQQMRGGSDASADWALLVGGYDVAAVRAAAKEISLPQATVGLYRLGFSLSAR